MKKAAELAEIHNHSKIEESDVKEAAVQFKEKQGQEIIRRLPPIERKILAYIFLNNPNGAAAYKWFMEIAAEHGVGTGLTTFYDYLNKLETVGLIEKEKHGRGRAKGLTMQLHVPPQILDEVRLSLKQKPTPPSPTVNVTQKDSP